MSHAKQQMFSLCVQLLGRLPKVTVASFTASAQHRQFKRRRPAAEVFVDTAHVLIAQRSRVSSADY